MTNDTVYWQTAHTACTPKQLRILELREIHGFTLRQIAYTTELSIGTVRMHLDAARHNIRRTLKETA